MNNRRSASKPLMAEPTQTLKEIDQEIAKLKERAASIIASEKAGVIERIKEAIAYYSLTAAELGIGGRAPAGKRGKSLSLGRSAKRTSGQATRGSAQVSSVAAPIKKRRAGAGEIKYKDDAGNRWSGFGPKPRWLTEALAGGKTLDDLKA